jgi:hypothetical protein
MRLVYVASSQVAKRSGDTMAGRVHKSPNKSPNKCENQTTLGRKKIPTSVVVGGVLVVYCLAALYPVAFAPSPGPTNREEHRHDDAQMLAEASRAAGWDPTDVQQVDASFCNIPRVPMNELSRDAFRETYLERAPVILLGAPNSDNTFANLVHREYLLEHFGNHSVTLSSANRNSYDKLETPLRVYLDRQKHMRPQPLHADGASTWYHFGDNKHEEWNDVFQHYERPTKYTFGPHTSLSFGIGPAGSGVPFHTHGHVFNEVLYGKKRWWLQAPMDNLEHDDGPRFDPDASSLQWLHRVRPTYSASEVSALHECVCVPGETLYIPSFWHHATLNIGETVFMASFV